MEYGITGFSKAITGGEQVVDERLKGILLLVVELKIVMCPRFQQLIEWVCHTGDVFDEFLLEIYQTKKRSWLSVFVGGWA